MSAIAVPRPKSKIKLTCLLLTGLFQGGLAFAAGSTFELGEVRVTGDAPGGEDQVASVITQEEIRKFNRENVGDAVNLLSGVNLSTNMRNEKMVYLRGYDPRQAPLFIDGLPVYVPYDGYVDFSRFTTADLAAIQVAKGFSSIMYGPNTLGGAINLVSRKPTKAVEGDVRIGVTSSNETLASVNLGSRQGMWYVQGGASYDKSGAFPLSSDFTPTATENGGSRENSYRKDNKVSFKLGLLPNATDEYVVSYYKQEGVKGQPPQTDVAPTSAKYWQWPFWDKESIAISTKTNLGETEVLKFKWYLDKYGNGLNTYSNSTYSVLSPNAVSGVSTYDDRTHGNIIELDSTRFENHEIKLTAQYKVDSHIARDGNKAMTESFHDTEVYWGGEDNIRLAPSLLLSLGWAATEMRPEYVYKTGTNFSLPGRKSKGNAQAGLFYDLAADARLYATVAEKSRLPTLKDRYSAKWGAYLENPGLRPETAVNYEVGYQGTPWRNTHAEAALFYNDIKDKIQTVYLAGNTTCTTNNCQMQNVGKVHVTGVELGLSTSITSWLDVGSNFTYTKMENISNPTTKLTDIPAKKLTLNATARPHEKVDVVAFIDADSGRWSSNTVKTGGFTTLNLKTVYRPMTGISTEVGVTNLTDRNYALSDGFPSPGRMWFANASYSF
jgi:iron complex outermembrane receptor protein